MRSTTPKEKDRDEDWNPEPLHLIPGQSGTGWVCSQFSLTLVTTRTKAKDILSTLVGIYGSRELFANEFAAMLTERLIGSTSFDAQQEVR